MENERDVANPYIIEGPVVDEALFFGRESALARAKEVLEAEGGKQVVVVQGSYRIGKSSFLIHLGRRLSTSFFLTDLSAAQDDSLESLLWRAATSIASNAQREAGVALPKPEVNDFLADANYFHEVFLPQVSAALKPKSLVLAFDGVSALGDGQGSLRQKFCDYAELLIGSELDVSFVLALEQWPERPGAFLEEAFRWRLGLFDHSTARELIIQPAAGALEYDYQAVKRILDLAGGHPYFTQLVCHLVYQHHEAEGRVSARDVEGVVEEAIELGSPYFEWMWDSPSPQARAVLAGFAALRGVHGILLEQDLKHLLGRRGAPSSLADLSQACKELVDLDVLEKLGVASYRFRVELVRIWVKNRRKVDSLLEVRRSKQVAHAAGDWLGKFLWPLIGLLAVVAVVFWGLTSWPPLTGINESSTTPAATETASTLSLVVVTPTPDMRFTATPVPTPQPPRLDIAYMAWHEEVDSWEIHAMSRDGSQATRLTENDVDDSSPVWSPDHRWMVFVSERDGNREIYRMNADGSEPLNLTNNPAPDWTPSLSPDGTRVVFSSLRDGNWELYLMDADGAQPARMTFNQQPDYSPAWSPDGSRIAFVSERDGNLEVYVMSADGSEEVRLTDNGALDLAPAWSPDGSMIAFESHRDGDMEIYVMNADGSEQRNITNYPQADDHGPSWIGDGAGIVFYSNRDGNWDLYSMNVHGGEATNLTNTPALEQEPFWSS